MELTAAGIHLGPDCLYHLNCKQLLPYTNQSEGPASLFGMREQIQFAASEWAIFAAKCYNLKQQFHNQTFLKCMSSQQLWQE
jgi:hypothetical protein